MTDLNNTQSLGAASPLLQHQQDERREAAPVASMGGTTPIRGTPTNNGGSSHNAGGGGSAGGGSLLGPDLVRATPTSGLASPLRQPPPTQPQQGDAGGVKLDIPAEPLGNSRLACGGHCLLASDYIASIFIGMMLVFFIGVFAYEMSIDIDLVWVTLVAGTLTLGTLAFLLLATTKDPGILPKRLNVDPASPFFRPPPPPGLSEFVMVNGVQVLTPYCHTCKITRPVRCAHCHTCNNCVEMFDHHCGVIGACIGRHNVRYFFGFLLFVAFTAAWEGGFSIWALVTYWSAPDELVRKAFGFMCSIAGTVIALQIGGMASHYGRLFCTGYTQREHIKRDRLYGVGMKNPFHHGWRDNCYEFLCI